MQAVPYAARSLNLTPASSDLASWIVNGKVTSTNPSSIPKGSSSPSSTSSSTSSSSSSTNSATGAAGQDASPTPGPVGPKTPAGAIAGGVVGGVVVLGLLAGTIVFFRRRAKKDQQTHTSATNTHNQSPHAQATSRTMSEAPQYGNKEPEKFASEAAGTERYEIGHQAKEKPWRQELE
ncbi:MAG: hypothetical protein LQ350_005060 [Teloschistes chrysophthalmus]|nr:MAG: hypothetical protein LQ350_005060 [Niorma chrysophthalma]